MLLNITFDMNLIILTAHRSSSNCEMCNADKILPDNHLVLLWKYSLHLFITFAQFVTRDLCIFRANVVETRFALAQRPRNIKRATMFVTYVNK